MLLRARKIAQGAAGAQKGATTAAHKAQAPGSSTKRDEGKSDHNSDDDDKESSTHKDL